MNIPINKTDVFGLVKPAIDAHTLGINSVAQMLQDCGLHAVIGNAEISQAIENPDSSANIKIIEKWIQSKQITRLGFSYRLDPADGFTIFTKLMYQFREWQLLAESGGPIRTVYFAGLPYACDLVQSEFLDRVIVFSGDETPRETLDKLGISDSFNSFQTKSQIQYDSTLQSFGRELINKGEYTQIQPLDRSSSSGFGTRNDSLVKRIEHGLAKDLPPLIRTHVGPYLANRTEALKLFLEWCRQLSKSALLDILSIGTSQLSQSHFGEDWKDMPNGGGLPINSPREFSDIRDAARPMLVRTYAGTTRMPELAHMYEKTINIAWHTFSFWWFCKIDGRGPLSVIDNLKMHYETLKIVAQYGKPYEPNVSHHFSFRGSDDVTQIVSSVLAARTAKRAGIRYLVLQQMLNTPKYTWGIQDLAKSRAMLRLVRELEDGSFKVFLQPRAGLDLFSPQKEKATAQLAAVTALMDDIEPNSRTSPEIVHVVNYSEGSHLADPEIIIESIKIVRAALYEYRRLRNLGHIEDMSTNEEVKFRTEELLNDARIVLSTIEKTVSHPYSPMGLYDIFAKGFLPVPYLWECREEFHRAVQWNTKMVRGSVKVVDQYNAIIPVKERMRQILELDN
ncbi:MAG: cobalamin-binding protein [Deltaproteobacteria bacterium]|nr:cobalamin-binding protein [Deltaproteobacteria bacterium]